MSSKDDSLKEKLKEIIDRYEAARIEHKTLYMDADEYADIAEEYIRQELYDKADEAIASGLRIHPDNETLLVVKISLYIDKNELTEARNLLNTVNGSESIDFELLNIELLTREDKTEQALERLKQFEEKDVDADTCLDIAYLCMDIDCTDKAAEWLGRADKMRPRNEEIRAAMAELHHLTTRFEEAVKIYNELIDINPYSSVYWLGLSKSYLNMLQYDKAIEAADFALVSDDNTGEALCIKAHAYFQLGNYEEGIKEYLAAWKQGALSDVFAYMFIGFSYIAMEDWDKAHTFLTNAATSLENDSFLLPDIYLNLARCLNKMNRNPEAHKFCDDIKGLFPDYPHSYIFDGQIYMEEGDREKAIQNWQKAINESPNSEVWHAIGVASLDFFDFTLADTAFRHVQELEPDYPELEKDIACAQIGLLREEEFNLYGDKYLEFIQETGMDIRDFMGIPDDILSGIQQKTKDQSPT